jgi:integrase/recombinase XerD
MFGTLFHYPRVLARHRNGPSADDRERYLAHCAQGGAARSTLLGLAPELLAISRRIALDNGRLIPSAEVEMAADRWVRYQRRHQRILTGRFSRERFIQTATAWLRFLERLQEQQPETPPFADLVQQFDSYLREERGLSSHTIHNRCWHVQAFLSWLSEKGCSIGEMRLEQVDAFFALRRMQGWSRVSMATLAGALRSFLRYAGEQTWFSKRLAAGIEGPRLFSHETLPAGPKWEDVRRLIRSTDTDSPHDIRDRAILLLLAVYGLRRGEVVALTIDDVDWEHDILHISRPKQRSKQDYPLAAEVGEAILRYLEQVRPHIVSRSLFVTIRAPFRPLAPTSLHYLVKRRLRVLNISCNHGGPHSLRHACATRLVAEGPGTIWAIAAPTQRAPMPRSIWLA